MTTAVKICGITDEEALYTAVEEGADYIGFNFFKTSPRYIDAADAADLSADLPELVAKVGLFVDPDDAALDHVLGQLRLDYIQLHGHETPERVDAVRLAYGVPVMKVIGVSEANDIEAAKDFSRHADMLLFDAKPPPGADRPGGNAVSFSWPVMKGYTGDLPWLLAGGLTPENVGQAVAESGAPGVDVSSGVESETGLKDPALIRAFIRAAKASGG